MTNINRDELPAAPNKNVREAMVERLRNMPEACPPEHTDAMVQMIRDGLMIFEAETDMLRLTKEGLDYNNTKAPGDYT